MKQLLVFIFLGTTHAVFPLNIFGQDFSWAQGFGAGINSTGIGKIAFDVNNDMYILSGFNGTIDFDQGPGMYNLTAVGNNNMTLLKEDATGNFIWAKHFPGLSSAVYGMAGRSITFDTAGNIYITGYFRDSFDFDPGPAVYKMSSIGNFSNAVTNVFILKLTSSGDFVWAKQLGNANLNNASGHGIKVDAAKNVYLLTHFSGTIDADPGPGIMNFFTGGTVLSKLDSLGNLIWARHIPASPSQTFAKDSNNNLYITGGFADSVDFDPGPGVAKLYGGGVFIAKYDSAGNYSWAKKVGQAGNNMSSQGIALDPSAKVLVTGYFGGTVDFDPGPGVYNLTSNSTRSIFTLRLRNNGDFSWARMAGAPVGLFNGRAVTTDSMANVYTAAELPGSCDMDPGPGVYNVPGGCAVQKLDSSGNFVWARGWGADIPGWIGLDHDNSVYVTGTFSGANVDFDPGPDTYLLSGSSQGSGFIQKLCQGQNSVTLTASDTVACVGDTVVLTAPVVAGAKYSWRRNTTWLTDTTSVLKITTTGSYTVKVQTGCPAYGSVLVNFYPKGSPTITLPASPMSVTIGQKAMIQATLTNAGTGYAIDWYKNGVLFTTVLGKDTGSYTKAAGTDTVVAVIRWQPDNKCYIPDTSNALMIDGVTSVNDVHTDGISVYPNPSSGFITFSSPAAINQIEITDITGKVVYTYAPNKTKTSVELSGRAAGLYFYVVTCGERKVRGKLVIH